MMTMHTFPSTPPRIRLLAATRIVAGLLVWSATVGPTSASDDAAVSLRSLVSQEVGLYIELRDLFSQQSRQEFRPLTQRFLNWPAYRQWRETQPSERLQQGVGLIEQIAGRPLLDVLERTLGVSSAVAVYPRHGDAPQEPTAMLVAFQSAEDLTETRQLWSRIDPRREEQFEHAGFVVTTRQSGGLGNQKPTQYVVQFDEILVVTNQQQLVEDVIERWAAIQDGSNAALPALNGLASFHRLRSRLSDKTRVSIFLNPLVWPAQSPPDSRNDPVGHWLHVKFTRCQGMILGFHADNGLVLEFHARFPQPLWEDVQTPSQRPAQDTAPDQRPLQAAHRAIESTTAEDSSLLRVRGALSGPLLAAAAHELRQGLPEKEQRDLQRLKVIVSGLLLQLDPVDDVLGQLGPQWDLDVQATNAEVPVAINLRTGLNPRSPEDSQRLQAGLRNLLATLVQAGNSELQNLPRPDGLRPDFRLEQHPQRSILRVTPILDGLEPGLELTSRQIRITSDLQRMSPKVPTSSSSKEVAEAGPDLEIEASVNRLRTWLADARGPLTKLMVRTQGIAPAEAKARLSRFSHTLQLVDRLKLELSVSGTDLSGRASLNVVNDL